MIHTDDPFLSDYHADIFVSLFSDTNLSITNYPCILTRQDPIYHHIQTPFIMLYPSIMIHWCLSFSTSSRFGSVVKMAMMMRQRSATPETEEDRVTLTDQLDPG